MVLGQEQEVCFPIEDAQKLYRIVAEHSIQVREIEFLKKQLELTEKESALKDKAFELERQRTEIYKEAFEKEKDLTDKALKLAEQTEKKAFWEKLGMFGIVIGIVVMACTL